MARLWSPARRGVASLDPPLVDATGISALFGGLTAISQAGWLTWKAVEGIIGAAQGWWIADWCLRHDHCYYSRSDAGGHCSKNCSN